MVEKNEYYAECPISCPGVHDTEKSALCGADFSGTGKGRYVASGCDSVLSEEFLGELGEIDAPVPPDVAAVGFVVFDGIPLLLAILFQF